MQSKSKATIIFFGLFTLFACNQKSPDRAINVSDHLPSSFLSFYEKFHSDSIYQMNHILFPLEGLPSDEVTAGSMDEFKWEKENWLLHRPFDDMGGTFNRSFLNFNNIIIEKIVSSGETYGMERRYTQQEGKWMLIYYSAMRQLN